MSIIVTTATNARLPRIARVTETATQTENISSQGITTSPPDAQMYTPDLEYQYNRIQASPANNLIDYTAFVYFGNSPDKTQQGELDVVFKGQDSTTATILGTSSQVNAFLRQYAYKGVVLNDGPFAYYRLGEVTISTAQDSSINSYNGTISATGVTKARPGAITGDPNNSMLFDGISGIVTTPLNPNGWGNFSIELWFNLVATSPSSYRRILASGFPQSSNPSFLNLGLEIVASPTSDPHGMYFNYGAGTYHAGWSFGAPLAAGQWYHIVISYTAASFIAYINGQAVLTDISPNDLIVNGTNPITLGGFPPNNFYTNCYIDEVAFYNQALTASQVLYHYQIGTAIYT